jgi:lysophospholipase L1-like esterase
MGPILANLRSHGRFAWVSRWLAAATALRPDVASVVVGINDTLRGDFDPERTGAAVSRTVAALRAAGAEVLTMRLPDRVRCSGPPPTRLAEVGWMTTQGHRVADPAVP